MYQLLSKMASIKKKSYTGAFLPKSSRYHQYEMWCLPDVLKFFAIVEPVLWHPKWQNPEIHILNTSLWHYLRAWSCNKLSMSWKVINALKSHWTQNLRIKFGNCIRSLSFHRLNSGTLVIEDTLVWRHMLHIVTTVEEISIFGTGNPFITHAN